MRRVASHGGDLGVPASQRLKLRLSSTAGMHLLGVPEDGPSQILHRTSRAARNFRPETRAASELLTENNSHSLDENGARTSGVENDTSQVDTTTRQPTPANISLELHTIDEVTSSAIVDTSQEQRGPDSGGVVSAVVKIQAGYRGFRARRSFLVERQKRTTAATKIQLCFQGKQLRRSFLLQKKAACLIQAHSRGFLLRRVVNRWGAAACTIQSAWRSHQVRERFLLEKNAVKVIQAHARGFLLRQEVSRWAFAACLIQSALRSHRARRVKNSAIFIQSYARGFLLRREVTRWASAACLIQRAWRSHRAWRVKNSASLIQAHTRGFLVRQAVSRWRTSASSIQRAWKSHRARREKNSASLMQSHARGFLARRVVSRWRASACSIQRAWRSHRAQREKNSASLIQSHARGFLARRAVSRWRDAARSIQRAWRSRQASRNDAAELIQAHFRGFLTRRVLRRWRASACIIQRAWRLHRAHEQRKRNLESKKTHAAKLIQAHARRFLIRRVASRWRAAAFLIQSSWRSSRARRWDSAACTIQRAWRSFREFKAASSEEVLVRRPVVEDWNRFDVDRVGDCLDTCLAQAHSRAVVSGLDLPERDHQDQPRVSPDVSLGYKQTLKEWRLQQLARVFLLQHQVAIQQQRAKLSPPFPPQPQESSKLGLGEDSEPAAGSGRRFNSVESSQEPSGDIVLDIQLLLEEVRNSSPSSSSVLFMEIESCEKQAALVGLKQINTLLVVFVAVVIYTRSLCQGVFLWAKQSASRK